MYPAVLLPLLAAVGLAVAVTAVHRRLPPKLAARAIAVTVVVVVGAAVPTLLIVGASYAGHLPLLGGRFEWCRHLMGAHQTTPGWAGLPALLLSGLGAARVIHVCRLHRRLCRDHADCVLVAGHSAAFAYTLPGRGGQVVVSTGLIDLLDDVEQRVVLAHEHAHARCRHDRYLLIGHLAAAAVPFLQPLCSRLQFSLERWADEAAAFSNGGDRRLVARTIGKVALSSTAPAMALSFAGVGVPARVAALLGPAAKRPMVQHVVAMWLAIATVAALAGYQLHHLLSLLAALCPG